MLPTDPAKPPSRSRFGLLANSSRLGRRFRRLREAVQPASLHREYLRRLNEWHLLQHWWTKPHTPYKAVFVIATPRSGSNLLLDCLGQAAGVQCNSEVLNWRMAIGPRRSAKPSQAIDHIRYSLQTLTAPMRVCKLFLNNLVHYRLTLDDLDRAFPAAQFLVLYRQSLAEQFTSMELANSTKQWLLLAGQRQQKNPVTIDAAAMRKYCSKMREQYEATLARPCLAGRAALSSYEELTADPQQHLSRHVFPLLGVAAGAVKSRLCKQNPEPLSERIANYAEVAELLHSPLCRQQYALPRQHSFGQDALARRPAA